MGIEPTSSAWKAEVLPLNYTRLTMRWVTFGSALTPNLVRNPHLTHLVEGGGFEPPKAEPTDLQSVPFGRSGTPPKDKPRIVLKGYVIVNRKTAQNIEKTGNFDELRHGGGFGLYNARGGGPDYF